jgi:hypothetical protein
MIYRSHPQQEHPYQILSWYRPVPGLVLAPSHPSTSESQSRNCCSHGCFPVESTHNGWSTTYDGNQGEDKSRWPRVIRTALEVRHFAGNTPVGSESITVADAKRGCISQGGWYHLVDQVIERSAILARVSTPASVFLGVL